MRVEDLPTNADWTAADWSEVFPGTDDGWSGGDYSGTYSVHDSSKVADVTPERISRVVAWEGHSPEGGGSVDFIALVRLTDRTWAACTAWADYTGWGCQANAQWKWGRTKRAVIEQGLDREGRKRLGVPLRGES